jgi:hypothetical protein
VSRGLGDVYKRQEVRDVLARLLMREDLSPTQRAEAEALMARLPGASR